jgi:hypothetical protein
MKKKEQEKGGKEAERVEGRKEGGREGRKEMNFTFWNQ